MTGKIAHFGEHWEEEQKGGSTGSGLRVNDDFPARRGEKEWWVCAPSGNSFS